MDAVEDIKARLSIEDVISEYVQLKRAGRNFKGLSPFAVEKTPSFMVSPEKQIWHDFSSGKGGNMFSFIMDIEGVDFKTALEILARKAGIDLSKYDRGSSGLLVKRKQRLYEILELATKFYQVQLTNNKSVLEYVFKVRGLDKQTVLDFKLGYSPNNGSALLQFLLKKSFTTKELQDAGIITRSYSKPMDMFRGRLMIPLCDGQGRVVGFTARLLDDEPSSPKYINTPQTIIYDKSRLVFGLHLAKESIRKSNFVVIVEGNLDVISSHKVGVKQVVATSGTAVTEQHLKILTNLTSDIRLAFDQDSAGLVAAERAIPIASKARINLSMVVINSAKDPDELIKKSPESWKKVINKPIYGIDWLINIYSEKLDLTQARDKRKFSDIILPTINKLSDPVEQDHYYTKVAQVLNVEKTSLLSKSNKFYAAIDEKLKSSRNMKPLDTAEVIEQLKNQNQLLAICLNNPDLRELLVDITPEMFLDASSITLLRFLKSNQDYTPEQDSMTSLNNISDYVKMLMLQYETLYQDLSKVELGYESKHLRDSLIRKFVKTQKDRLSLAMQEANQDKTQNLLHEARKLDQLLKTTGE